MRCLVFASKLRNNDYDVAFICQSREANMIEYIRSNGFYVSVISETNNWQKDADETICLIRSIYKKFIEWIIVDHYELDYKWEKVLREYTNKIMVIDDLANREHDCNILLDQNYYHNMEERYIKYVSPCTTLLLGPQYLLLREEFINARKNIGTRARHIQNIFVFFGGSDMKNYTQKALDCIKRLNRSDITVNVAIGSQNPYRKNISKICESSANMKLYVQTNKIAELMAQADIAIGSGGISTYERIYLKLPSLVITLADNQEEALKALVDKKWIEPFSNEEELYDSLVQILKKGTIPIDTPVEAGVNKIYTIMRTDGINIKILKCLDVRRTFYWLHDIDLLNDFMMKTRPVRNHHFKYWRKILKDSSQIVQAIYYKNKHIGNCGIKNFSKKERAGEIWIYIGEKECRSRGFAKSSLILLINKFLFEFPNGVLYLHVKEMNKKAIALYKSLNFMEIKEKKSIEWINNENMIYMELQK
ncbi:FlaR protein [Sulfurimonas gotlandica GD1]|nr:FlaR protein [Sulfurimonas gotlandica GD1]